MPCITNNDEKRSKLQKKLNLLQLDEQDILYDLDNPGLTKKFDKGSLQKKLSKNRQKQSKFRKKLLKSGQSVTLPSAAPAAGFSMGGSAMGSTKGVQSVPVVGSRSLSDATTLHGQALPDENFSYAQGIVPQASLNREESHLGDMNNGFHYNPEKPRSSQLTPSFQSSFDCRDFALISQTLSDYPGSLVSVPANNAKSNSFSTQVTQVYAARSQSKDGSRSQSKDGSRSQSKEGSQARVVPYGRSIPRPPPTDERSSQIDDPSDPSRRLMPMQSKQPRASILNHNKIYDATTGMSPTPEAYDSKLADNNSPPTTDRTVGFPFISDSVSKPKKSESRMSDVRKSDTRLSDTKSKQHSHSLSSANLYHHNKSLSRSVINDRPHSISIEDKKLYHEIDLLEEERGIDAPEPKVMTLDSVKLDERKEKGSSSYLPKEKGTSSSSYLKPTTRGVLSSDKRHRSFATSINYNGVRYRNAAVETDQQLGSLNYDAPLIPPGLPSFKDATVKTRGVDDSSMSTITSNSNYPAHTRSSSPAPRVSKSASSEPLPTPTPIPIPQSLAEPLLESEDETTSYYSYSDDTVVYHHHVPKRFCACRMTDKCNHIKTHECRNRHVHHHSVHSHAHNPVGGHVCTNKVV